MAQTTQNCNVSLTIMGWTSTSYHSLAVKMSLSVCGNLLVIGMLITPCFAIDFTGGAHACRNIIVEDSDPSKADCDLVDDVGWRWILQVSSILVAAGGLLYTGYQLHLNLERSRRELASELIREWPDRMDFAITTAIKLIDDLTVEEIRAIKAQKNAELSGTNYDRLCFILRLRFGEVFSEASAGDSNSNGENRDNRHKVDAEKCLYIYWLWNQYINRLEGSLAAWAEAVADPEMMAEQFEEILIFVRNRIEKLEIDSENIPNISRFLGKLDDGAKLTIKRPLSAFPRLWQSTK